MNRLHILAFCSKNTKNAIFTDEIARVFYRLAHVTTTAEICDGSECDGRSSRLNDASVDQQDDNGSATLAKVSSAVILAPVLTLLTAILWN